MAYATVTRAEVKPVKPPIEKVKLELSLEEAFFVLVLTGSVLGTQNGMRGISDDVYQSLSDALEYWDVRRLDAEQIIDIDLPKWTESDNYPDFGSEEFAANKLIEFRAMIAKFRELSSQ